MEWYRREKRPLPWRDAPDPYAILVSEVMLQQTQVATVVPYFRRFMERFPTLADLANASEAEVLRLWEGLGYYSRARHLRQAAQTILERFGGVVPDSAEELRRLPGVGRYTAGAVASLAYNRNEPLLDANVARVLTRLFRVKGNPKSSAVQRRLWELAETLLPDGEARDFNAALMELGALVCIPSQPRCGECPLKGMCAAFRHGEVSRLPELPSPSPTLSVTDVAVLVEREETLLLTERLRKGVWGGLWELPRVRVGEGESLEEAAHRATASVCGVRAHLRGIFGLVRHSVTRYRIRLHGFQAEWKSGEGTPILCASVAWVPREQVKEYPLASPQRKLLALAFSKGLLKGESS